MLGAISRRFDGTSPGTDNLALVTLDNTVCRNFRKFQLVVTAGIADVDVNGTGPVPIANTVGAALASNELNIAAPATAVGYIAGPLESLVLRTKGATNPTTGYVVASDPIGS